jgi:hypothetical protein
MCLIFSKPDHFNGRFTAPVAPGYFALARKYVSGVEFIAWNPTNISFD